MFGGVQITGLVHKVIERRSQAGASLTSILIFRVVLPEPAEIEKCSVFPQFTLRIRVLAPTHREVTHYKSPDVGIISTWEITSNFYVNLVTQTVPRWKNSTQI